MRTLVALTIGLVLGVGAFEVFLRVVGPIRGQSLQGQSVLLPTNRVYIYNNVGIRGYDARIVDTKNSLGFRGPNPPGDFANWLTLVAVGGSATECFYLSDGKDWPARVGARLQPVFDRLWINNAGLDGHSTFGHLLLLEGYLSRLKPKMVLLLVGANDVGRGDPNEHDAKILRSPGLKSVFVMGCREIQNRSRTIGLIQYFYRTIRAKRGGAVHGTTDLKTLPHLAGSEKKYDLLHQEHERLFLPPYERRLEEMIQLCRKSNMEPVLITNPVLYGDQVDDETGVNLGEIQVDSQTNGRMAWKLLELYNDRTRQLAKRENILLIDLARQMPKSSRYFCDFYHLTNSGADEAARLIVEPLEPYLAAHYPSYLKRKQSRSAAGSEKIVHSSANR